MEKFTRDSQLIHLQKMTLNLLTQLSKYQQLKTAKKLRSMQSALNRLDVNRK